MHPDSCSQAAGTFKTEEEAYFEQWQSECHDGILKRKINGFLFEHANPRWSLGKAEIMAGKIYDLMINNISD